MIITNVLTYGTNQMITLASGAGGWS